MASKTGSYWKNFVMNFYDNKGHPAFRYGLWANCPIQAIKCDPSLAHVFFDEFFTYVDGSPFIVSVYPGGAPVGTSGITAGIGGWFHLYSDGDDKDESYAVTTGESWLFVKDKPLWFECSLKLSEASTSKAGYIIGLSDAAGENMLTDDAGGPAGTYDGAVFYKYDGTMNIYFETSNGGTQATSTTMKTTCVSGTEYRLGFYYNGAATTGVIIPYINGVAKTAQNITNSGLEEMELFFGVKAGTSAEEHLEVNWIKCVQLR